MTLAAIFAGQGAECVGMGLDVARASPSARAWLDRASAACGTDVSKAIARGTAAMRRTSVLQPALVAVQLGYFAWLEAKGFAPDVVAGHSLGEITAWSAAGVLAPEDAIDLAARRGASMEQAAARSPGGMIALVGRDAQRVDEALSIGGSHGTVALAARNADDECAVSGDEAAITAIRRAMPEARVVPVAGAWHSPAMEHAMPPWREAVDEVGLHAMRRDVVSGVTGTAHRTNEDFRALVTEALVRPVRWTACLDTLAVRGIRRVVVVGPGKALRALVRRHHGAFDVTVVDEV